MALPRASTHVAIVAPACLGAILDGRKTIESRLSRTRRAPFGRVRPGDRIYFKASGGPFGAAAVIDRVLSASGLSPEGVQALAAKYDCRVLGGDAYWRAKAASRFATLIWLRGVRPTSSGPMFRPVGRPASSHAWFTLTPPSQPLRRAKSRMKSARALQPSAGIAL